MIKSGDIIIDLKKNRKVLEVKKKIKREYLGKQGVWVLLGDDGKSRLLCLNVGKSTDIGGEILYDVSCLTSIDSPEAPDREYINQFQEYCGFKWMKNETRECLYPHIAQNYVRLKFVFVAEADNDKKARDMEKDIANEFHAIYWRNGKSYKNRKFDSPQINTQNTFSNMKEYATRLSSFFDLKGKIQ